MMPDIETWEASEAAYDAGQWQDIDEVIEELASPTDQRPVWRPAWVWLIRIRR